MRHCPTPPGPLDQKFGRRSVREERARPRVSKNFLVLPVLGSPEGLHAPTLCTCEGQPNESFTGTSVLLAGLRTHGTNGCRRILPARIGGHETGLTMTSNAAPLVKKKCLAAPSGQQQVETLRQHVG